MVHRLGGGDVGAAGSDNDAELDFPVDLGGDRFLDAEFVVGPDHGGGRLGEDLRRLGQLDLGAARPIALGDMFLVVAADAEHVLGRARDRGGQFHRGCLGDGRRELAVIRVVFEPARLLRRGGAAGDEGEHVVAGRHAA